MKIASTLIAVALTTHAATANGDCKSPLTDSYAQAAAAYPHLRQAIQLVAAQPIAQWFTDRQSDLTTVARDLFHRKCAPSSISQASAGDSRPTIVVYGLPQKDCGHGFSTDGQNKNREDYRKFLQLLADSAGKQEVIYILEPDAIGLLAENGCGNARGYADNLAMALEILSTNPKADIYLDIGYWTVMSDDKAAKVAELVKKVDTAGRCKGISLNTSNYRSVREMKDSCERFARVSGKNYHCIIDTSRNFAAPPASNEWCNTKDMGIGSLPTKATGHALIDYFVWVKPPGESDGQCSGRTADSLAGPSAGAFFADHFTQLWNNGVFVKQLGQAPIGAITGQYAATPSMATTTPAPGSTMSASPPVSAIPVLESWSQPSISAATPSAAPPSTALPSKAVESSHVEYSVESQHQDVSVAYESGDHNSASPPPRTASTIPKSVAALDHHKACA